MFEFLIANGHPPESVEEYSWDKLKLYFEAAHNREALRRIDEQITFLQLASLATGSVYKKGAQSVRAELNQLDQHRKNLIASIEGKGQIDVLVARLMKSGVPRRSHGK